MAITAITTQTQFQGDASTVKNDQEAQNSNEENLFNNFDDWTSNHSTNIENFNETLNWGSESYDKLKDLTAKANQIKDENKRQEFLDQISKIQTKIDGVLDDAEQCYETKQEEIGSSFDFSQGNDISSDESYYNQLYKLSADEIEVKDTDGDGLLSYDEYFAAETKGIDDPKVLEQAETILNGMFDSYDVVDDENPEKDGKLSEKELAKFYLDLDAADGNQDCKISIDSL